MTLRGDCTYRDTVTILSSRLHGRGRNAVIASFAGNDLLKAASAPRTFA